MGSESGLLELFDKVFLLESVRMHIVQFNKFRLDSWLCLLKVGIQTLKLKLDSNNYLTDLII